MLLPGKEKTRRVLPLIRRGKKTLVVAVVEVVVVRGSAEGDDVRSHQRYSQWDGTDPP